MKFHQVILELSHKRGKIAYLDQVHWPLTLDIGRISPKILSVHLLPVVHPCTKFDENPPRVFFRFRVNGGENSIFRPSSLTFDLWRWGGSRPKSNQFIYSWWCTPVPSLMKFHQVILELSRKRGKNSIFRTSSLTFDPWRWADLAQNLISSSTPGPRCIKLTINGNFVFNGNYHQNKTP